jgi:hypothetical protein
MCRAKSQLASFAGRGHGGRCERLRRTNQILCQSIDIHVKDMIDHMQLNAFYPFAFGKSNLPETGVFRTGSGL